MIQPLALSNRLSKLFVIMALALFAVGGGWFAITNVTSSSADTSDTTNEMVNSYAVKVVCSPLLGPTGRPLLIGKYKTAVNIHNPWPYPVDYVKWVTLSNPQGVPSISSGRIHDWIEPYMSFDVDCKAMSKKVNGATVPGGDGFFILQSYQELDVVAVYTASRSTNLGVGTSIDVEYINPRMVPQEPPHTDGPDLIAEIYTTVFPPPDCPLGGNCIIKGLTFEIRNIGTVDAPASTALIKAEEMTDLMMSIPVIPAGGSTGPIVVDMPPGTGFNCYNPDCTVDVIADFTDVVAETDEGNNSDSATFLG